MFLFSSLQTEHWFAANILRHSATIKYKILQLCREMQHNKTCVCVCSEPIPSLTLWRINQKYQRIYCSDNLIIHLFIKSRCFQTSGEEICKERCFQRNTAGFVFFDASQTRNYIGNRCPRLPIKCCPPTFKIRH